MHELGIVFRILDMVRDIAAENRLEEVSSVTLELGEVSGIVFEQLQSCWNWAVKKEDPPLRGAALCLEQIPAVTVCNACGKTYPTVQHGKRCPHCGSTDTVLLTGNEVAVKEIEAR